MRPVRPRDDRGFTMIELSVAIALMGALAGFVVSGWQSWSASRSHSSAAVALQSTLRDAQQQAVTEGSSTCVLFDVPGDRWRLYSGRCDSDTKVLIGGPWSWDDDRLDLTFAGFAHDSAIQLPGVTFTPRGTATPGRLTVGRRDDTVVHTVRVEGLTGRVFVG